MEQEVDEGDGNEEIEAEQQPAADLEAGGSVS